MRKRSLFLFLVLVLLTTLLAGCGSSEGDKFVGRWVGDSVVVSKEKVYLDISTKDGKTFGIKYVNADGSPAIGMSSNAILKENYLEISPLERLMVGPDGTFNFGSGVNFTKVK